MTGGSLLSFPIAISTSRVVDSLCLEYIEDAMKGAAVLLAVFAGVFFTSPCGSQSNSSPTSLPSVEVREYEGKNLSSVDDFRENSIKGPQRVNEFSYRLLVRGLVKDPLSLTYDQVVSRPQYSKVVTLNCVEGWSATILWEGVRISDLLAQAGADPKAAVIIFAAQDGYSTSLPMEFIVGKNILLASKMNGITIPVERGFPFVLVAEDKWGYKWIRWVTDVVVSNDTEYRGYWESRGYNQKGDLRGPRSE